MSKITVQQVEFDPGRTSRHADRAAKKEHPSWRTPKIREKRSRLNLGIHTPAISTVHAVLDRHGLEQHGRRAITARLVT
jgi:hypothetical protein